MFQRPPKGDSFGALGGASKSKANVPESVAPPSGLRLAVFSPVKAGRGPTAFLQRGFQDRPRLTPLLCARSPPAFQRLQTKEKGNRMCSGK